MVYADLHVHTDHSDGQMALDDVPAAARSAGVRTVAITDHDRLHPHLSEPVVEFPGRDWEETVTVVRGIELRVEADDQRVDLLGYGVEEGSDLEEMVDRVQRDRRERGRKIIECVEERLGADLGLEPRRGIGRPHVARAIDDHPDTGLDYEGAFEELIGDGCPCYVARSIPTFEEGVEVLRAACGLVSLAHPLRYGDPAAALELTAALDGVELHYPYGREVDRTPVEAAVEEHALVVTGGSDAHDDRLGLAGLSRSEYERVEKHLRV